MAMLRKGYSNHRRELRHLLQAVQRQQVKVIGFAGSKREPTENLEGMVCLLRPHISQYRRRRDFHQLLQLHNADCRAG